MSSEYFECSIQQVTKHFVKTALKDHDWEAVAVDTSKGIIIFRRFNYEGTLLTPTKGNDGSGCARDTET